MATGIIKFVSLTDYCLVEYRMEPLGSTQIINIPFFATKRGDSTVQIYNEDAYLYTTKNVKDLTVMPLDGGKYVYLDQEKIPNYTLYDTTVSESLIAGYNPVVDKVRIHFATGFNFSEVQKLVFSIKQNLTDERTGLLACLLLDQLTSQYLLTFNPKPIFLRDSSYDRYIEITIPSLKSIDEEFYTSSNRPSTFAYQITDGIGFIQNSPISISLDECTPAPDLVTNNTKYEIFNTVRHFETDVVQVNEFDNLGVHIQESTVGDYIEFFATWNSGFPEELISVLNTRTGENWILIHQLTVYEQVGTSFIKTANLVQYQTDNFDAPQKFRPILEHAEEAISMTIDYTVRLLNQNNGDQIIRSGSLVVLNPNKYGAHLVSIKLKDLPESQKIYNKLIKKNFDSTLLFIGPSNTTSTILPNTTTASVGTTITQFVPMFYESQNIAVSEESHMVTVKDTNDVIAFGQGKLPIVVKPFDNIFKFKVYTKITKPGVADVIQPMDLNLNSSLSLVFNTSDGQVTVESINDQTKANPSLGEILFKVTKDDSKKILQSNDNNFHLISIATDGTQTSFYSGKWYSVDDRDEVNSIYQTEKDNLETIADLRNKVAELEAQLQQAKDNENISIKASPDNAILLKFDPTNKARFQNTLNAKLSKITNIQTG